MAQVISLDERRRGGQRDQIIKKVVDGKVVECVNIDALPVDRQSAYLRDDDRVAE